MLQVSRLNGNKKTVFKNTVHSLQESELFYKKNQGNVRKKIGNVKILQILQKTHFAQRRKKIVLLYGKARFSSILKNQFLDKNQSSWLWFFLFFYSIESYPHFLIVDKFFKC